MIILFNIIATLCTTITPFIIVFKLYSKGIYDGKSFIKGIIVSFILNYIILTFYNSYFQSYITIDESKNIILNILLIILWMGLAALIEYFILYFSFDKLIKDKTENKLINAGFGYSSLYNALFLGTYSAEMLLARITLLVMGEDKIPEYHKILDSYNSLDINLFIILSLQAIIHIFIFQKVSKSIMNKNDRLLAFILVFEFCFVTKFLISYSILLTYVGILIEIITLFIIYKRRKEDGIKRSV